MVPAQTVSIQTIAVISAGIMGRGIAQAAALGGYRTILEDLLPHALRKADDEIRIHLHRAVNTNEVSVEAANAALVRLVYAESVEEAAREADFVIEAVPDELESKVEIFTLLDKICRPHTMLAASSGWLSIAEISAVTYRREKCVGMRFTVPVYDQKRLEIVHTPDTDEQTLNAAMEVGRRMGKDVDVADDAPVIASVAPRS